MLDRPIASGSANAQNSWVSVAGSHTARVPTWRSVDTATSMSAVSTRSPTRASSSLARVTTSPAGARPPPTQPAARPAPVARPADRSERSEHALDHAGLLGRREHRGLSNQAPDVPTRQRVRHNPGDRIPHRDPPPGPYSARLSVKGE